MNAHTHTRRHTTDRPVCPDRWRRRREGAGGSVLIAVNQAVRWEDRGGRRIAVNSDLLPGRRDADVRERERERVNNLERWTEFQQARGERGGNEAGEQTDGKREEIEGERGQTETKGGRCQY